MVSILYFTLFHIKCATGVNTHFLILGLKIIGLKNKNKLDLYNFLVLQIR